MPAYCKFYGMQPSEFWGLRMAEFDALGGFMGDYAEAVRSAG
jgi:hypothetical protein